jgi:predicted Zn finger-like uncharacterized protein
MRIVCPACDATYDVPDAMLAGGLRLVRCAKCGNEWPPTPVSEAPLPPSDLEFEQDAAFGPEHAPPDQGGAPPGHEADAHARHEPRLKPLRPRVEVRLAEPPEPPTDLPPARGGVKAIAAWAASLLFLAAAAGAAVTWRGQVMAAWPPSERVFSAVGLR